MDGRVYMLPMNYQGAHRLRLAGPRRPDGQIRHRVSWTPLDEAPRPYMQAIVANEPSLIPLDVGSGLRHVSSCSTVIWQKASWESDAKGDSPLRGAVAHRPHRQRRARTDPDGAAVNDHAGPAGHLQGVTLSKREGLDATAASGARNAVVNTQNNTESFQAGKSALAADERQHRPRASTRTLAGRASRSGTCVCSTRRRMFPRS